MKLSLTLVALASLLTVNAAAVDRQRNTKSSQPAAWEDTRDARMAPAIAERAIGRPIVTEVPPPVRIAPIKGAPIGVEETYKIHAARAVKVDSIWAAMPAGNAEQKKVFDTQANVQGIRDPSEVRKDGIRISEHS